MLGRNAYIAAIECKLKCGKERLRSKGHSEMDILFITPGIEDAAFGGPKGSIRNYEALKKYGNVVSYTFKRKSSVKSLLSLIEGYYPPLNHSDYEEIKKLNEKYRFKLVFFDTSIYGAIIDIFKDSKKAVFCHNCEYDYNKGVRFGEKRNIKKMMYLSAIYKNEGYLLRNADYRIVFLKRDSDRLYEVYGMKADLIVPLGIKDTVSNNLAKKGKGEYCLLFGACGTANVEGYQWFVKNVSPFLSCRTVVAGKGFDICKGTWSNDKVDVYGYVEDMDGLYNNALAVSVPLFSGGGMKVKVVEALMFGRDVFGTDEAFEGFDTDGLTCMHRCNTAEEYISEINGLISVGNGGYNEMSRRVYEERYGTESTGILFDKMILDLGLHD